MLFFAYSYFHNRSKPTDSFRLMVNAPENTSFTGAIALSPDGSKIAFISETGGVGTLWVRPLNSLKPQRLAGTDGASFPFWSADGRSIGFFADRKLKKIELAGGPPQILADASGDPRGGSWNRFGDILFGPSFQGPIYRTSASGNKPVPATVLNSEHKEQSHRWPAFLPDGRHFLYFSFGGGQPGSIHLGSLDSKETKLVVNARSMTSYAPPGFLLFTRERTLMAQPFDLKKFAVKDEPFPIAEDVATHYDIGGFRAFSVSENGVLAYRTGQNPASQLVLVDRKGAMIKSFGTPATYLYPSISPDGSRALISKVDIETTKGDLWLFDLSREVVSRFTSDVEDESTPVWSPDGTRVVFSSDKSGVINLHWKAADSSAGDELVLKSKIFNSPRDWSTDGRYILYAVLDPLSNFDLWVLPLFGEGKPFAILATAFEEWDGQFSFDNRWIVYTSNESGGKEVYVRPFRGPGQKLQISTAGGSMPKWRKDGKELFYVAADGKLMAVQTHVGADIDASSPVALFDSNVIDHPERQYDASVDGQHFLINRKLESTTSAIAIVLNWNAQLKK
jgi:eukaryotic-like serine/threonine-protein kinase